MIFGDGTRQAVLHAAGVKMPRAVVICYSDRERSLKATNTLRMAYPTVPLFAFAQDFK